MNGTRKLALGALLAVGFLPRAAHADGATVAVGPEDDPDLLLHFSGYVHVDWVAYAEASEDELSPATREPQNQMRFVLRRARIRSEYESKYFFGAIELDGNTVAEPTVRILDAEASVRWPNPGARPYLAATVGLMKIPFGLDVPESERNTLFLEKTNVSRALFPGNYDLGAKLEGNWEFLRATAAAMNGAPIGERQFPGEDPNKSRDVLGRLGVDLDLGQRLHFVAGASALWGTGFHEGNAATKDVLVWRDANENGIVEITEVQVLPGTAATASENFERFAVGGDVRFAVDVPVIGELGLQGEILRAQNLDRSATPADPIAAGRDLAEWGGYLALTQELTKYARIGARYDRYDPDGDASDQLPLELVPADRSVSTWAFTASGGYPPYGRLTAEFDLNHNHAGRGPSGLPETYPDNRFTLRAEAGF